MSLALLLPFRERSSRLEDLDLTRCTMLDESTEYIMRETAVFPRLIKLKLANGDLSARGACNLLTSDRLPALRQLDISGNRLGDFIGRRLRTAKDFPSLDFLRAAECELSSAGIAELVAWRGFAGLRKLVLSGNVLNHADVEAITSADSSNLRTLALCDCNFHGSHIRALAQSRFVRSLWNLDLRGNEVDDAFIRALIETPFLDALQCLLLDLPDDDAGYDRLKARFGDRFQSA